MGLFVPLSIYESRRAQRGQVTAVEVQDEIPLVDGNCILVDNTQSSSELSVAKDCGQTW